MARRRTARKRTRRTRRFKLLNALEAYTYASILSMGIFNQSPIGFLGVGQAGPMAPQNGAGVNLSTLLQNPQSALQMASKNAQDNLVPMAINSFIVGASFKVAKSLLRKPVSSVNRSIMQPLFGKSVGL